MTSINTHAASPAIVDIPRGLTAKQYGDIKETAQQFEDFFVYQMLELMSPEPDEDSIMGGSFGEQMYRQQMNEYLADDIGSTGGMGIAEAVERQLIHLQATASVLQPTTAARSYQNGAATQKQAATGQTINTLQ